MKMRDVVMTFGVATALSGCVSVALDGTEDVVVQSSVRVAVEDPAKDKSGDFFLRRSLLCRQVFAEAMTKVAEKTGRDEDTLRGATISGIEEGYTNGVYTLRLDVAWSEAREAAVDRILSVTNSASVARYAPSEDECKALANWIGPKHIQDADGRIHFLGISAMAIGRNSVLSQQNIRRAGLDAQAMAVCAFMGKDAKFSNVKASFRQVFSMRSRHPLCPDREMYACGYEVIALTSP